MKNTLMFLMVSLLLAFSLTACGGGQTNGTAGEYGSNGQTGGTNGTVAGNNGTAAGNNDSVAGSGGSDRSYSENGSYNRDGENGSLMDDARDAVDDAGRSFRGALDDAGNAMERAF